MNINFRKGCKDTDRSVLKVRGKGLARLQYRTLLRTPVQDNMRQSKPSQSSAATSSMATLYVNQDCSLHDTHPDTPHLRHLALASAYSGNYDCAIATFNHLLDAHPNSAVDYNNRGLVHFHAGQLDLAIADYNQALELNPHLDSAYNNRANYHAAKGSFLEAILDYNMALELNPENIRAWINQGITFRDLQLYGRALENFNLALTFNQLEAHIYAERGRTHHLSGDWNWAIADYKRASQFLNQATQRPSDKRLSRKVKRWMDELFRNLERPEA